MIASESGLTGRPASSGRPPVFRTLCSLLLAGPLLALPSLAQHLGGSDMGAGALGIHVVELNDHPVTHVMHVRLMGPGGATPVAEGYSDDAGQVTFSGIEPGMYHLLISGEGYEDTDSGSFEVDRRKAAQTMFVRVRPAVNSGAALAGNSKDPMVDVSMLKVPKKARQEYDKGNDQLSQKNWAKGAEHLQKAITLYPDFVNAYNNLAVAYANLGDFAQERAALDHALQLDPHCAQALRNRALLAVREKDPAAAENWMSQAGAADPTNPDVLVLLARLQFARAHYDAMISTAQRIHQLPHEKYAAIHYLAARALESEHRIKDAEAELQVFLLEESKGPRADAARREMGLLQSGALTRPPGSN